jgi:hypothetical protein
MAGMATHKSGLPISPHGDPGELSKPQSAPPGRRAWIALSMLIVVYVLNFLSRQLPGILAKPIASLGRSAWPDWRSLFCSFLLLHLHSGGLARRQDQQVESFGSRMCCLERGNDVLRRSG